MDKTSWRMRYRRPVLLVTYAILLFLVGWNFKEVLGVAQGFLAIARPIVVGFVIAFVANMPLRFVEKIIRDRGRSKLWSKLRRPLCLVISYILLTAFISALFFLLIPALSENVEILTKNFPRYLRSVDNWIRQVGQSFELDLSFLETTDTYIRQLLATAGKWLEENTSQLFTLTKSITSAVYTAFLGVVISVFLLAGKEKFIRQLRKLVAALFKEPVAQKIYAVGTLTCDTFNHYIAGQLIESVILGTLCFLGMSLFRMPYAPIISVVICICNMVPVVGSLLGTIPCALLIFMINPTQAFWFIIFIIVLQQCENNLIYPHVVGTSIGLSGLWVITAVLIFGGLFGVMGVFLGVPTMSVLYHLVAAGVNEKLAKRREEKERQNALHEQVQEADADTEERSPAQPSGEASAQDASAVSSGKEAPQSGIADK